jgi:Ca-activated chloride channel family protein
VRDGDPIGGLINYESVLLSLNAKGTLPEPLVLVYPTDGVVTADYPLTMLSAAPAEARGRYDQAVEYLRRPEVQRQIMERTHRRPVVPQVATDARFGGGTLVEVPFPVHLDVANALIQSFNDVARRAPNTIYVLDLSGSMRGGRIEALKTAMLGLSGADSSLSGRFSTFHGRERVTLVTFDGGVDQPRTFVVPEKNPQPELDRIREVVNQWQAAGDTALYEALVVAYQLAGEQVRAAPERVTTIVLLSDGERTSGRDLGQFRDFYRGLPPATRAVPVFPVLFGESAEAEMAEVAELTGGRTFDGRSALQIAFKEIRGYQ